MKLNEHIASLKGKYVAVSPIKLLAKKKGIELYQIQVKNKITQTYLIFVDKHKKVLEYKKASIKEVDKIVRHFKKTAIVVVNEFNKHKQLLKQKERIELENKVHNTLKQKQEKLKSNPHFKSEKQLIDITFAFMVASIFLDYLKEYKYIKVENKIIKKTNEMDIDVKHIYDTYMYIVRHLDTLGVEEGKVKYDIVKIKADRIIERVFKKYNNNLPHFPILMGLYLLELWREDVKNKTIHIEYNSKLLTDIIEQVEKNLQNEGQENNRENSQKLAYDMFYELYKERIKTKQETKKFFKNLKGV